MHTDSLKQLAKSVEYLSLSLVDPICTMASGRDYLIDVRVVNRGSSTLHWSQGAPLTIASRWFLAGDTVHHLSEGERAFFDFLEPGAEQTTRLRVRTPDIYGPAILRISCVCEGVCWFYDEFDLGWVDLAVEVVSPALWPEELQGSNQSLALRGYVGALALQRGFADAEPIEFVASATEPRESRLESDDIEESSTSAVETWTTLNFPPLNTELLNSISFALEVEAEPESEQLTDPKFRWVRHPLRSLRDFFQSMLGTSSIAQATARIQQQNDANYAQIKALNSRLASVRDASVEILGEQERRQSIYFECMRKFIQQVEAKSRKDNQLVRELNRDVLNSIATTTKGLMEAERRANMLVLNKIELMKDGNAKKLALLTARLDDQTLAQKVAKAEARSREVKVFNSINENRRLIEDMNLLLADKPNDILQEGVSAGIQAAQAGLGELKSEISSGVAALSEKIDILIHRQIVSAPKSDIFIARNELGLFAIPSDDIETLSYYSSGSIPEPGSLAVVEKFLGPGSCFIDVGANIGLFTVAAGRIVGQNGRIIAIEPAPNTMSALKATVRLNGLSSLVDFHGIAAGGKVGCAELNIGKVCGHSSLYPLNDPASTASVRIFPLDEIIGKKKVDLIKIDVEGFELDVIEGLAKTLSANPNISIIVEFAPVHLSRSGRTVSDWIAMVAKHGFTIYAINEELGSLEEVRLPALLNVSSVNLLLARAKHLELIRN